MNQSSRPRTLLITLLGISLLGMWNIWRTAVLVEQGSLLLELGSHLDSRFRLGVALFWALLFIALAGALLLRRPGVRLWLPLALLFYVFYRLLLVALFVTAPAARRGWQLALVLSIMAFAWTVWSLWRPANIHYWFPGNVGSDKLTSESAR